MGKSIKDFNFRTVTGRFSKLVYQFPIRIPERLLSKRAYTVV